MLSKAIEKICRPEGGIIICRLLALSNAALFSKLLTWFATRVDTGREDFLLFLFSVLDLTPKDDLGYLLKPKFFFFVDFQTFRCGLAPELYPPLYQNIGCAKAQGLV